MLFFTKIKLKNHVGKGCRYFHKPALICLRRKQRHQMLAASRENNAGLLIAGVVMAYLYIYIYIYIKKKKNTNLTAKSVAHFSSIYRRFVTTLFQLTYSSFLMASTCNLQYLLLPLTLTSSSKDLITNFTHSIITLFPGKQKHNDVLYVRVFHHLTFHATSFSG